MYYYLLYTIITFTAAGILAILSLYAWRRRSVTGGTGFFGMMIIGWGWMLFWALELISQDLTLKSLFNNIRYSFALFTTYSTVVFLLQFTGQACWLHSRHLVILALIPMIGLLLVWTNPLHHLIWQGYPLQQVGDWLVPVRRYGWWFYVQAGYNQLMVLVEIGLLTRAVITLRPPYRTQALIVFLAVISVIVADLLWLLQLVPGLGLYPFSLVLLGLLIAWALFRYQFLDLVPVSHNLLIQNMPDSLLVLDNRLRVVDLNPAAQRLTGYLPAQAIGRPALEILPPHPLWYSLLETEQVANADIDLSLQGTQQIYDAQITTLRDQSGILTGHFIVLRDITERKRIELSLHVSEERFRMLAENAQHIIFRLKLLPQPHFEYISPAITTLTGYSPDEVYADPEVCLRAAYPESRSRLLQISEGGDTAGEPIILHYLRKDGREIWVEQEQWNIYDEQGQLVAVEGVARDITRRILAEQQRSEQQQTLIMLREREHLARELHDSLGQVLGYVNTQAQATRDLLHTAAVPQISAMLDQIVMVSQEVLSDIREYILGVRLSSVPTLPAVSITEQRTFFQALESYLQQFAQLTDIETDLDLPSGIETISFAPTVETHLLRIIQEALTNVRKHAQATRVIVRVQVISVTSAALLAIEQIIDPEDERRRWLAVSIEDNGRGFVPPAGDKIPPTAQSGYGLSSMRGRAEECGGYLAIDAAPAGGTCVIVRIPLRRQHDIVYHSLRVLLVDDNPLFLQGLMNLLVGRGFQVVGTAADGNLAIAQAYSLRPDIILMDVQMPNCDGLAATRQIKHDLPAIQIVMLTVSDDEAHLFDALKSGASGYLLKSLDGDELCTLLRGVVYGEVPLSPGLAQKLLHEFARPTPTSEPDPETALSEHLLQVLQLVAQGLTYREVGEHLGYAERTIKKYMGQIMSQLHLKNRAEAVAYARRSLQQGNAER